MESPKAILLNSLIERLKLKATKTRYINQDLGQLENYDLRPAVSWPCALIDLDGTKYSDAGGQLIQLGEGVLSIRSGMVRYTDSDNLVPENIRVNALEYYEVEHEIFKALHGWAPPGFSKLIRVSDGSEKRDDDIRVRMQVFSYSYTDESAKPVRQKVPRPEADIHGSTTT